MGERKRPGAADKCSWSPGGGGSAGRRLIAAALVLAAIWVGGVPAVGALTSDISGTQYEPAVSALREVGIVGLEWAVSLRPQELLTRAEEARLLTRALVGEVNARGFLPLRFPDVAADHWAKPYIDTAVWLKLMPGRPGAAFNPDGRVARGQFAADVLRLCGYRPADATAAMELAGRLGLFDGAPAAYAYITRGDAVIMAYRAFFGIVNPELGSTLARRVFGSRLRPVAPGDQTPPLELHFLPNVGATLVRLPSGADWLVNTGRPATLPTLFAYLARLGIDRLDALIITDGAAAPAGAVAAVADRLAPTRTVNCVELAAAAQPFPAELLMRDKDIKVDLLFRPDANAGAIRIARGSLRALLADGLGAADERYFVERDRSALAADVWLPAALGAYEQHDGDFLLAVGPSYVFGRTGADGGAWSFAQGIQAAGAELLLPGDDGATRVNIGSRSITVATSTAGVR